MSNRGSYLVTPDILLRAYAAGIFPMAESAEARELRWFDPPIRALIPLDDHFHVSRSLLRTIKKHPFKVTFNAAFEKTMRGCAAPAPGREVTWINRTIIDLYTRLHRRGHAHSIEVWDDEGELVGGLYGVTLGSAFFGESMFSRKRDASKIALVYTAALLRACKFTLFDTQFQTDHLAKFGTFEVTRANYQHLLTEAIARQPEKLKPPVDWDEFVVSSFAEKNFPAT